MNSTQSSFPLPNETLVSIFRLLPFYDVISTQSVCRRFHDVIVSNWKYMKKVQISVRVEVKEFPPSHYIVLGETEPSDRVHIMFKENGSVCCITENKANDSQLWLIMRRFFKQKEDCLENHHNTGVFTGGKSLEYKTSQLQEEMENIFAFTIHTFKIRKLYSGAFNGVSEILENCFKRLDHAKTSTIPIHLSKLTQHHVQLYQALKSQRVIVHSGHSNLLLLDTSVEIELENTSYAMKRIGRLIKEWCSNLRNINRITELKQFHMTELGFDDVKQYFQSELPSAILEKETHNVLEFSLKRSSDMKTLSVRFSLNFRGFLFLPAAVCLLQFAARRLEIFRKRPGLLALPQEEDLLMYHIDQTFIFSENVLLHDLLFSITMMSLPLQIFHNLRNVVMGALLDRLRGRPRLQPAKIQAVWNGYIAHHHDYFHKVMRNVVRRDEGMRDIFMANKHHAQNEEENDFVLGLLANRIRDFFHSIVADEVLNNASELKRLCYTMGQQHSAFSKETFKLVYWDEFTLAMLEELEEGGGVARDALSAWQTLLHLVNEHMLAGYHDARAAMRM